MAAAPVHQQLQGSQCHSSHAWAPPRRLFARAGSCRHRRRTCAASSIGPAAPAPRNKPEWVRVLEDDADVDEDVADLLKGTDGDPDKIRAKMQATLSQRQLFTEGQGSERPPHITFREVSPFNLWMWVQFEGGAPGRREQELLQAVVQAWFMLGKMGSYNSQNLQVFYNAGDDQSFFDYSREELDSSQGSYLHDVTALEQQDDWVRFRVDMGTCDELAVDLLLNALIGFSRDVAALATVCVGGDNPDWPTPAYEEEEQGWGDEGLRPDIDPMQLPEGVDEELELLDDLQAVEAAERQQGVSDKQQKAWGSSLMRKYSELEFKQAFRTRD